jgi:hypothetical protein
MRLYKCLVLAFRRFITIGTHSAIESLFSWAYTILIFLRLLLFWFSRLWLGLIQVLEVCLWTDSMRHRHVMDCVMLFIVYGIAALKEWLVELLRLMVYCSLSLCNISGSGKVNLLVELRWLLTFWRLVVSIVHIRFLFLVNWGVLWSLFLLSWCYRLEVSWSFIYFSELGGFSALLEQYFSHLFYGYCTLHVNPLVFYIVMVAHLQNKVNALDVIVSDEAKPSWLMCSFVL